LLRLLRTEKIIYKERSLYIKKAITSFYTIYRILYIKESTILAFIIYFLSTYPFYIYR
jgi:hypothetical protein